MGSKTKRPGVYVACADVCSEAKERKRYFRRIEEDAGYTPRCKGCKDDLIDVPLTLGGDR